jgi:hypothetical protein
MWQTYNHQSARESGKPRDTGLLGGVAALFTRTTGFLIVPLWLAAMGWLVAHDVWPVWTAQDPPRLTATDWLKGKGNKAQFTVFCDNAPVGTIWTNYLIGSASVQRYDLIWIERFPIGIAPLRVNVDSTFTGEGLLDELSVYLVNGDASVSLHGERFHADFSFTLKSGTIERAFKIPLTHGELIAGAFNPFTQLTDLRVGQTWWMQVFNPVAALTGVGDRFISMLVEVTGEETIATPEGERRCLVVQSPNAKAWVDARGAVLAQEMTLPVAGKIRIVREADFDEEGMIAVRRKTLGPRTPRRRRG